MGPLFLTFSLVPYLQQKKKKKERKASVLSLLPPALTSTVDASHASFYAFSLYYLFCSDDHGASTTYRPPSLPTSTCVAFCVVLLIDSRPFVPLLLLHLILPFSPHPHYLSPDPFEFLHAKTHTCACGMPIPTRWAIPSYPDAIYLPAIPFPH